MLNRMIAKAYVEKVADDEEGVLEVAIASSGSTDRHGDIIDQEGWNLKNFKKNPVLLWGHNSYETRPPIGKIMKIWTDGEGKRKKLLFKPKFDLKDEFAALIYHKYKEGYLNSFSVGFMPLDQEDNKYTKQELLEVSAVPVPANADANVRRDLEDSKLGFVTWKSIFESVRKAEPGIEAAGEPITEIKIHPNEHSTQLQDPKEFEKFRRVSGERAYYKKKFDVIYGKTGDSWAEQMYLYNKDIWDVDSAQKHSSIHGGAFEAAVTERRVVPFSMFEASLENKPWNHTLAEEQVRARAQVGKEEFKWPEYRKAFAWFNDNSPEDFKSYKFLHHDVEGGELCTVWAGVKLAMALLMGARGGVEIPESDKKEVYNHLVRHYEQFGKEAPAFKFVKDQALAELEDEITATQVSKGLSAIRGQVKSLRNEVKQVLKKKEKKEVGINELATAISIVNLALDKALKREVKKKNG